jgi:hypothetical protein
VPSDARCGYISATGHLALSDPIPIMALKRRIAPETEMRSTLTDGSLVLARRIWQSPTVTKLPIRTATKSASGSEIQSDSGRRMNPSGPATPASKLGFSFEMSFPLAARTE